MNAGIGVDWVAKGDHANNERGGKEGVEGEVEGVPEAKIVAADFPEFAQFITQKTGSEEVEYSFHNVEVAGVVDGIDGGCIESEVKNVKEDLDCILILRSSHAVGIEMVFVSSTGFLFPGDESAWCGIVLHEPSLPEIRYALLISGRPNDTQTMQINSPLNGVCRLRLLAFDDDTVLLE